MKTITLAVTTMLLLAAITMTAMPQSQTGNTACACIPVSGSKSPPADDDPHLGFVRGADFGRAD